MITWMIIKSLSLLHGRDIALTFRVPTKKLVLLLKNDGAACISEMGTPQHIFSIGSLFFQL